MSETPATLGGSRAYGTPTEESDWDVVVLIDPVTRSALVDAFGSERGSAGHIKVGKLNLILAASRRDYDVWLDGIAQLKARKPVTREEAVALFTRLRGEAQRPGVCLKCKMPFDPSNHTEDEPCQ